MTLFKVGFTRVPTPIPGLHVVVRDDAEVANIASIRRTVLVSGRTTKEAMGYVRRARAATPFCCYTGPVCDSDPRLRSTPKSPGPFGVGPRVLGDGPLGIDWGTASPLGLKLKSLGAQADDLHILLQVLKRRVIVAAHDNVVRETDAPRQVTALLAGMTCAYKRWENGERSILSLQHPGDFCDLHRYILPDLEPAVGVQALTDCTVAVIEYRDMDKLLSRPTLASACWRASILEAAVCRERLSRSGRGTALKRVAHLICEQLARREAVGIHAPQLPLSQTDVADAAGLSAVHVNRTIQTLRGLNVLSKAGHAIEVVDRKQLAEIAGFDGRYLNMPKLLSRWGGGLQAGGADQRPDDRGPT